MNLKRIRENTGYTQEDIAKLTGITLRSYIGIENSKHLPNVKTAIKIAKILHSTVEELFS